MQGDIVRIRNSAGTLLVTYAYDAYGMNSPTYSNGGEDTIAAKNPFRYRGYYYDEELMFYYLNSRYYDPVVCRFINADSYVSTGQGVIGNNMYAYCNNNPVMFLDPSGESLVIIGIILGITTAIGATIGAIVSEIQNDSGWEKAKDITIGAFLGLAGGGLLVAASGALTAVFTGSLNTSFLGVTAKVGSATGILVYNVAVTLLLPLFGINMEPIDYDSNSNPAPTPPKNQPYWKYNTFN